MKDLYCGYEALLGLKPGPKCELVALLVPLGRTLTSMLKAEDIWKSFLKQAFLQNFPLSLEMLTLAL